MKKFTIEISHASTAQLQTIAAELKIMANSWEKFGPRIAINGQAVEPPKLRLAPTDLSNKRATGTTRKRHKLAMFL
jgi:hypothetical protein